MGSEFFVLWIIIELIKVGCFAAAVLKNKYLTKNIDGRAAKDHFIGK